MTKPARTADASVAGFVVLGLIAIHAGVLALTGNHFVYALDDPYIHLSLAEGIGAGTYGINPGEASSPASSILWPLLLAPFAGFGVVVWLPLVWNALLAVATALILRRVVSRLIRPATSRPVRWSAAVAILVVLSTNVIGLVHTGMEHSLHLFLVAVIFLGLSRLVADAEPPRWWLWAAIVVGVLVRYEHLAVAGPALVVLWGLGHRRGALGAGAAIAALLAGYSAFLLSLGLDPIPASVQAKSFVVQGAGPFDGVLFNILNNLEAPQAWALLMLALLLMLAAHRLRLETGERLFAWAFAAGGVAHLVVGRFGWLHRYEPYMVLTLVLATLIVWRRVWPGHLRPASFAAAVVVTTLLLPYGPELARVPRAAQDIYEQQVQMARFANEHWGRAVGVNDIGLVSYRSEAYVLDFWGLASQEALHLRQSHAHDDPRWMERLARRHDVELVMIYDAWFDARPAGWIPLGALIADQTPSVIAGGDRISFYARGEAAAEEARVALDAFARGLPAGVRFEPATVDGW